MNKFTCVIRINTLLMVWNEVIVCVPQFSGTVYVTGLRKGYVSALISSQKP